MGEKTSPEYCFSQIDGPLPTSNGLLGWGWGLGEDPTLETLSVTYEACWRKRRMYLSFIATAHNVLV